jgi:hypothetical protein
MKVKKSFYNWCIENNRQDYLDRWSNKNNINPSDIEFRSHKKFYFNCNVNKNHNEHLVSLSNLVKYKDLYCLECNSFAEWCLSNNKLYILELWDYEKNGISPFFVFILIQ